ncbi:hypothetical protein [Polaromonas sp. OV174]|uniref:hypothetical protein n=1 Tax=Polaromonas sp. OV174 TaxID=1855300 RepID=UPI0015A55E2E|nr:hypothetical protein [Polaromonas sp. OV174]
MAVIVTTERCASMAEPKGVARPSAFEIDEAPALRTGLRACARQLLDRHAA